MGRTLPSQARGPDAAHRSRFCVGGVSVQLGGDHEEDVALVSSLEPFRVETGVSDIHVRVERVANLSRSSGRQLFNSGSTWELHEGEAGLQFDFNAAIFGDRAFKRLLIDARFQDATLQMNGECLAGYSSAVEPLGYPLDELLIMHRLTQEKAIELHGSGIVRADGVGNLFVGHSGAGKSTTTRLWTEREDVEVLSDDRIIVRRDEETPMVPPAETLLGAPSASLGISARGSDAAQAPQLRLRDCSASRSNLSAQDDKTRNAQDDSAKSDRSDKKKMRMYGTPWHGEAMYASPNSAPLARIFVLEHGHGNVITRLSPSQAVAELFARSFVPFHRHEYVDAALEFLQELVDAVPVYRYAFEPDPRAVDKIIHFDDLHFHD